MSRTQTNTSKREYVSVIDGAELELESSSQIYDPVIEADAQYEQTLVDDEILSKNSKSVTLRSERKSEAIITSSIRDSA